MEKTAKEVIAAGDVRAAVDFAIELHRRIAAQGKELDEAKRYLRDIARDEVGDSGIRTTEIIGYLGVASVVFERDSIKTRRDMNLADIEENLSDEAFAKLFVTRVVVEPTQDFLDKLADLSPSEKAVIENFLDIQPSTPKVYLPK
jgi:hypothetical protein